jgi:hypothetical protein
MSAMRLNYFFFCLMIFGASHLYSQEAEEQSVITIIGDESLDAENTHDFVNTNPYEQPIAPPANQKIINDNQKGVTPSFDNGFNMRFESSYSKPAERLGGSSFAVNSNMYDDDYEKAKKHTASITERAFNAKKKLRKWLPKRKKKYRPTMCGRF